MPFICATGASVCADQHMDTAHPIQILAGGTAVVVQPDRIRVDNRYTRRITAPLQGWVFEDLIQFP